jgi:uncharacterized protein YgbK (DUF1537 family)
MRSIAFATDAERRTTGTRKRILFIVGSITITALRQLDKILGQRWEQKQFLYI